MTWLRLFMSDYLGHIQDLRNWHNLRLRSRRQGGAWEPGKDDDTSYGG